jgi:hypothetical protein
MRRSTVLSLPFQLGFLGRAIFGSVTFGQKPFGRQTCVDVRTFVGESQLCSILSLTLKEEMKLALI